LFDALMVTLQKALISSTSILPQTISAQGAVQREQIIQYLAGNGEVKAHLHRIRKTG
jgi:hypothetical protein